MGFIDEKLNGTDIDYVHDINVVLKTTNNKEVQAENLMNLLWVISGERNLSIETKNEFNN